MNTGEVNDMLSCFRNFIGTFSKDQIPIVLTRPAFYVINLDHSSKPGSHWIGIYFSKNNDAMYFDSFARPPTDLYIIQFLQSNEPRNIFYNDLLLQPTNSENCGMYVGFFLIMIDREVSFEDLSQVFSKNLMLNDLLVEKLMLSWRERIYKERHYSHF